MLYTYCDLSTPFAKRMFEGMAIPVYDHHVPSLMLIDFIEGRAFG